MHVATCLVLLLPTWTDRSMTVEDLKNPAWAAVGPGGVVYVSLMGEEGKKGDGSIVTVDPTLGKVKTYATGLDDPAGILVLKDGLFVADGKRVWWVDDRGKSEVFLAADAFPRSPVALCGLAADAFGNFYVSDAGDRAGKAGAVFRFDLKKRVSLILDAEITSPRIASPAGILVDDADHLFVADYGEGYLCRFDMITGNVQRLGGGFGGMVGLTSDRAGGLFASDGKDGRLFQYSSEFEPAISIPGKFKSAGGIALTPNGRSLIVPDRKSGTLTFFPLP